jgi:hypothetical protein
LICIRFVEIESNIRVEEEICVPSVSEAKQIAKIEERSIITKYDIKERAMMDLKHLKTMPSIIDEKKGYTLHFEKSLSDFKIEFK